MWELTECRGKGEGYFPLRDGLFRRYVPSFQPLLDNYRGWVEYTFSTDMTGTVIFKNAAGILAVINELSLILYEMYAENPGMNPIATALVFMFSLGFVMGFRVDAVNQLKLKWRFHENRKKCDSC